ncbi:transposase [Aneurinibacillus aneurinilyticus]|uniref:transposase n=1 Tax=Aneurinibacillus aneurinilyticus TaxID=1391 RepID=UPI003525C730
MYILQETLFSFEEWLKLESKERLELFFSSLDLRPYAKQLKSHTPQGAPGYCREAILRAFLAAPMEGITTFTMLHRRLQTDLRFRYQCGFRLDQDVPSVSTFSRVFANMVEKQIAEQLFHDLVSSCQNEGLMITQHLAIDSTAIEAYKRKQPKKKSETTGNATWGAKFDTYGNKITWFGYKIHLAVDTESELPIAVEVTPAHVNDGDMGPALMNKAAEVSDIDIEFIMMDAGYDQLKNYEAAHELNAQAIIPLNLRNEKEPPTGFSFNGTPRCSMGFDMVYWGADKQYLKFRCPHTVGKVDCPHGSAWCSPSDYGMVVKVNPNDDLRRFSIPHRDTKRWKELYNKRTSVERVFARLKENLTVNQLHIRGIQKVKTQVFLNLCILLASALAMSKASIRQRCA